MINPLDRLIFIKDKILDSENIGIIANQCSYSYFFKKYIFEFIPVKKVFLLEHGFFSELQDQVSINNVEFYKSYKDIQWISLYGNHWESLFPKKEDIEDLEILIIDIQDVGSRYYTFLTSVYFFLNLIIKENLKIKIIILDRPNPLIEVFQSRTYEGTPLQKEYESFVGISNIIHKHGLMPAELIYYYWLQLNKQNNPSCLYFISYNKDVPIQQIYPKNNIILEQQNYKLNKFYKNNYLNFDIYPSPNMPTLKTAVVYTGQCLLEGTNLSEGRGTTKPFEIFGAPYINKNIQDRISNLEIFSKLGVIFRNIRFIPVSNKYKNIPCNGWQIHIFDKKKYHSLFTTLVFLKKLKDITTDFDWYKEIYEFKNEYLAIQYLLGDSYLFEFLNSNSISFDDVYGYLKNNEYLWSKIIKNFFLYTIN